MDMFNHKRCWKKGMLQFTLVLLLSWVAIVPALSAETSGINQNYIGRSLSLYEDASKTQKINELSFPAFKPALVDIPSFGFSSSNHWVRINLKDMGSPEQLRNSLLLIDFAPINSIEVYYQLAGKFRRIYTTGTDFAFSTRPIADRRFLFPLTPTTEIPEAILLKVSATNALMLPISIISLKEYISSTNQSALLWGLYFGFGIIIACYNLFLFFFMREPVYLLYFIYALSFDAIIATLNGHAFAYVWPSSPWINHFSIGFFTFLMMCSAGLFAKEFMETKKYFPRSDRFIKYFSTICLLFAFYGFIAQSDLSKQAAILAGLFAPLMLTIGVNAFLQRSGTWRYFIFAWPVLLAGIALYALLVLGFLPANIVTIHLKEVGSIIDIVLLSFGLAKKMKLLTEENFRVVLEIEKNEKMKEEKDKKIHLLKGLAGSIAHELRSPLAVLKGNLAIIQKKPTYKLNEDNFIIPNETLNEMMYTIDHAYQVIHIILNNMKNQDTISHAFKKLQAAACVERAINEYAFEGDDKNYVHFNLEEDFTFLGDETYLMYALFNLLKNATYYFKSGAHNLIEIRLKSGDLYNSIEFKDYGPGIDQEKRETLFVNFMTSGKKEGTGLGLAFCKNVMESFGGDISCESKEGAFTVFTLKFPLCIT